MFFVEKLKKEKEELKGAIPEHVAVIMDGNRRWAKKRLLPLVAGHFAGANALKRIVRDAAEVGIKALTVYAFSTENWIRPQVEVDALFKVLESYLIQERGSMVKEGVALKTIGKVEKFPESLVDVLNETKNMTAGGKTIELVLALNYGARDELKRAIQAMMREGIKEEQVTEELVSHYLDTSDRKDPDLLIRTSGEMRLSNFLLWQLSYTEVYVTDVLWPDFSKKHLLQAVKEYQRRDKRWGA